MGSVASVAELLIQTLLSQVSTESIGTSIGELITSGSQSGTPEA